MLKQSAQVIQTTTFLFDQFSERITNPRKETDRCYVDLQEDGGNGLCKEETSF